MEKNHCTLLFYVSSPDKKRHKSQPNLPEIDFQSQPCIPNPIPSTLLPSPAFETEERKVGKICPRRSWESAALHPPLLTIKIKGPVFKAGFKPATEGFGLPLPTSFAIIPNPFWLFWTSFRARAPEPFSRLPDLHFPSRRPVPAPEKPRKASPGRPQLIAARSLPAKKTWRISQCPDPPTAWFHPKVRLLAVF